MIILFGISIKARRWTVDRYTTGAIVSKVNTSPENGEADVVGGVIKRNLRGPWCVSRRYSYRRHGLPPQAEEDLRPAALRETDRPERCRVVRHREKL